MPATRWTCATCGADVTEESPLTVAEMGWQITGPGTGLCPQCADQEQINFERMVESQLSKARARRQRR